MTNRLFISADIPDEIKDKVIEFRDNIYGSNNNVKWENKTKLHFTLKFLGDVEDNKIKSIQIILEDLLKELSPIKCAFGKFGLFKRNEMPSVLWLGIKFNKELIQLSELINNSLEKIGFEKEKRKFKPHLTLIRLKGNENLEKINGFLDFDLPETKFEINEISLMKSELLSSGSFYNKIKSFKLNK
ncbi:MAG: RNA 2',3'-cyclic phosphodiesterase [Bacteroidetes bacterium]|nr:RNA 2',3'-cyclic phosphodiesterase [Bacteroidota bacterium]